MKNFVEFSPEILNCEDEQIHLCGKIQDIGCLLVFNEERDCIAVSKNCCEWLGKSLGDLLIKPIAYYESLFKIDINFELEDLKIKSSKNKVDTYPYLFSNKQGPL